jgi:hypothetical protein
MRVRFTDRRADGRVRRITAMSTMGHSRRFDPRPITSTRPRLADFSEPVGMSRRCHNRKSAQSSNLRAALSTRPLSGSTCTTCSPFCSMSTT